MSLRLHSLLALAPLLGLLSFAAGAARAASSPVGYDLSFPQCEAPAPLAPSFVVVGVNGGLANDPNPCLATQLTLAGTAPGLTRPRQPGLSLYLIAADPGNTVPDWPSAATATSNVSTPYGTCDGRWSRACAFLYGEQRAGYSYALTAAIAPATGASAPWWIDVEIEASWATRGDSREWSVLNIAALRGYTAGLRGAGAQGPIGLYSNAYQWRAVTGLGPRSSRAYFRGGERDWVTGSSSLASARRTCSKPFSGSTVALAQFTEGTHDRDYACPPARKHTRTHSR
jgi:hypothetical protein